MKVTLLVAALLAVLVGPPVFRKLFPQTPALPAAISAPIGHGHPHCPGCRKHMTNDADQTRIEDYDFAICSESCEKIVRANPHRYRLFQVQETISVAPGLGQ